MKIRLAAFLLLAATALAQSPTAKIVAAADAFLATLDEKQKSAVLFAFDDEAQRARWSNFPISVVRRGGLRLKELSAPQRGAVMALLGSALSPRGLAKVQQIMEGDEQLNKGGRENAMFGKDLYFVSILGTPSATSPWMLQFGGHHLAINLTIDGARGVLTPSHTAAQPALFTLDGQTVRPLGGESDKAAALFATLDEAQRKQAVLGYRITDLVLGPGKDGKTIQPEGLKASAMTEPQRAMLIDVIAEWVGIVNDSAAAPRLAEIKAALDDTYFAWSGPADPVAPGRNIAAYYRIQGPKLVIEFSPQRMGNDPSMHVHTMYRDPTNDYGRVAAKK